MNEIFSGQDETVTPSRRQLREAREQSKKKSRKGRAFITVVLALALVTGAVWLVLPTVTGLFSNSGASDYKGAGAGNVQVELPTGATGKRIATILREADVVASEQAFIDAYNKNPNAKSIQAGFYKLRLQMSGEQAVLALLDPNSRAELSIYVPEGWRATSIYDRVASVLKIDRAEVERVAREEQQAYGLPPEAGGNPEGWFGAQTYKFKPNTKVTEVLRAMVADTVKTLERLNIPRAKWKESLIMASIAQKEALPQDFSKVVRVILNRANPGNKVTAGKLGMETVVNYGLGLDGVIPSKEQKEKDTPYNVFLRSGLPPTPICTPSIKAIEATINPPAGPWNFFVTTNLVTGETKFAETYEQFLVIQKEFQDWLAANPQHHPNK